MDTTKVAKLDNKFRVKLKLDNEFRVKLWDLINEYCESCGGDPSKFVCGNTRRQNKVVEIESLIAKEIDDPYWFREIKERNKEIGRRMKERGMVESE